MPTVVQLDNFPGYADAAAEKFPAYADHMRDLHARRRDTIMAAYEAGVAIYAGTDAGGVLPHGGIADEVLELAAYGFKPADALGAASWRARAWLGHDGTLAEGTSADFVVVPPRPAGGPHRAARAHAGRAARRGRGLSRPVGGSSAVRLAAGCGVRGLAC